MKRRWWVVGFVLVLIGGTLIFVPIAPQPDRTIVSTSTSPPETYLASIDGFSWSGSIAIAVSWTSNTSVVVFGAACSGSCTNPAQATGVVESGTSGSFTLYQPVGGSFAVVGGSRSGGAASVTFTFTTALASVGSALVGVGLVLAIVAIVLRPKPAKESALPVELPPPTPANDAPGGPIPPSG